MNIPFFGYLIQIKVKVNRRGNLPTTRWQIRKLAVKVEEVAQELYPIDSPKIARIKALRQIFPDEPSVLGEPRSKLGLKTCKEWVEFAFGNYGSGDII